MNAISSTEAAERLGVSRMTVTRWIKSGRLKGYKSGKNWIVEDLRGTQGHRVVFTVDGLHAIHGEVAAVRPVVSTEEVHELCLFLQGRGWAGILCLREAVEALLPVPKQDPS